MKQVPNDPKDDIGRREALEIIARSDAVIGISLLTLSIDRAYAKPMVVAISKIDTLPGDSNGDEQPLTCLWSCTGCTHGCTTSDVHCSSEEFQSAR